MKNEDIKKAFESLTPSDDAKERMLKAIIAKSAAAPDVKPAKTESTPWHIRLKVPIGVCTAAMACAAAFAITLLNPGLLNNDKTDNFVGTQPFCENTDIFTSTAITEPVTQASETALTVKKSGGMAACAAMTTDCITKNVKEEISFTETVMSQKPADVSTTIITETTAATTTSVKTTENPANTTTLTKSTDHTETSDESNSTGSSLYGNLFDFRSITWAGISYSTDYIETSYDNINSFLGSGAAVNYETNKVYTVLIYELKNVPIEKGFAVQYIGQSNYYVFYSD